MAIKYRESWGAFELREGDVVEVGEERQCSGAVRRRRGRHKPRCPPASAAPAAELPAPHESMGGVVPSSCQPAKFTAQAQ